MGELNAVCRALAVLVLSLFYDVIKGHQMSRCCETNVNVWGMMIAEHHYNPDAGKHLQKHCNREKRWYLVSMLQQCSHTGNAKDLLATVSIFISSIWRPHITSAYWAWLYHRHRPMLDFLELTVSVSEFVNASMGVRYGHKYLPCKSWPKEGHGRHFTASIST